MDALIEKFARQQHRAITSIALSPDAKYLACAQPEHVQLWRLSDGEINASLTEAPFEASALAFSADSKRLAACNLSGATCVWALPEASVVASKPASTSRRRRALAYRIESPGALLPMEFADAMNSPLRRCPTPDGRRLAVVQNANNVWVRARMKPAPLALFDLFGHAETQRGVQAMAWSLDGTRLLLAGPGWLGLWHPMPDSGHAGTTFAVTSLAAGLHVTSLALFGEHVIFAWENKLQCMPAPTQAATLVLTPWQRVLRLADEIAPTDTLAAKRDWRWETSPRSYEGVRINDAHMLFYSDDVYGWGGASEQAFEDFLLSGPVGGLVGFESRVLAEVVYRLRQFIANKSNPR